MPWVSGFFLYFNTRVFFPQKSVVFLAACQQGIYESDNLRVLIGLVRPDTWMFDIGTNIGLMTVPVLAHEPQMRVLSFEPSPSTLPSLERTIAGCCHRDRWSLVAKAVGSKVGTATFHLASMENSPFEGLQDTGRVSGTISVIVEMTTVDVEWARVGRPKVGVIKCDIEGGESAMLEGASDCIATCRPALLLEWNATNLAAWKVAPESLLELAKRYSYAVHAVPGLAEVRSNPALAAHMKFTESFLLLPL